MGCTRRALLLGLTVCLGAWAETVRYEVRGRLVPATSASVWLHGATAPFEDSTLADESGQFRFHDLLPGTYTLGVFVPARGEMRRTIEIGPSHADARKRVALSVELRDEDFESKDSLRHSAMVSVKELAIPDQARREYDEAEKKLAKRDVQEAVAHLERAVELAPQFAAAWNHLGTIAYQSRDYARAESSFRKALDADPGFYQALVNLGGVLLNLKQANEALNYNLYAALSRPNDALANSQLGMNYFLLNRLDLSRKYLTIATHLDPGHFSHPQLILAEIDLRQHDRAAAAGELEEFLQYHPDSPEAGRVKENLARLRTQADPAQSYAGTGMAHSFTEQPDLPLLDTGPFRVSRRDGRYFLESRDASGQVREERIDATIGSGRHLRILLHRSGQTWEELSVAWYPDGSGRYGPDPGFGFSASCMACHSSSDGSQVSAIGCQACHGSAAGGKPSQSVCAQCHLESNSRHSAHGTSPADSDDHFELNSAAYRLLQSRCYQAMAGKLTCATCHPAHGFSKNTAELRMVCRSCHPETHERAALDCNHCHMPKRHTQDAGGVLVTDHRIQRPL
ncbi:MAG TPA: tetratricopeptide repeat protein [Bryobacteraceae bacterium]|nr:tetratricopeptide repeat protein [Bryobacteraceae bacterium]